MKTWLKYPCSIALWLPLATAAEIATDGSMGAMMDLSGPQFAIPQSMGTSAGNNLFHSFSRFNLASGQSATFSGANGINNIISRVTGGSPSSIDGLLRSSIPGANLFFLNPYGVFFGPNASIDVSGGFHASTAHYLELADGEQWDAGTPDNGALSVAPPAAFGFASDNVAPIQINGSTLQAEAGQTLTLAGGDIALTDGVLASAGGQLNIASVGSAGRIPVDVQNTNLGSFTNPGQVTLLDASGAPKLVGGKLLQNLDISGEGGGRIVIRAGKLYMANAKIRSQNDASQADGPVGGNIDIQTTGSVEMSESAQVYSSSAGQTRAGDLSIKAGELNLSGFAAINSDTGNTGDGGTVSVNAGSVSLIESAEISANTLGDGQGGSVVVTADSLTMADSTSIRTLTAFACDTPGCSKDSGNISINANRIDMQGDATVDTSTFFDSEGKAGKITVHAEQLRMKDDAWFISNSFAPGDAGQVDMQVGELSMQGRAVVSTTTFTSGAGGVVNMQGNTLNMAGSAIITSGTEGPGSGGDVNIQVAQLKLRDQARISSESEGNNGFVRGSADLSGAVGGGMGGNINISMSDTLIADGAQITASTAGVGDAGNIRLAGHTLTIRDGAQISASSSGTGVAGSIIINLSNYLHLLNGLISVQTDTSDAGDIEITATQLVHLVNSVISTSAANGLGNGGNINIDPVFVVLNNSQIIAQASAGNGGNIHIVTDNFITDTASLVDASSDYGLDGTVSIESPGDEASTSPDEAPTGFAEAIEIASDQCELKTRKDISSLIVADRDTLPASPDHMLSTVRSTAGPATGRGLSLHGIDDQLYAIVCLK